ncbi:Major facilitator superfamily transporter-permease [Streptococcus sp. DD11]|uniref:MFS transporter n=1 Tax=Streptococcus sp. DD11 TaxID=1777879 RepID=UPI000798713B
MLLLNGVIEKYLTERQMIVTGLLIFSLCSFVPLFDQSYWLIFASRLIFGMGLGLLNAKAISIISERYQGRERVQLLGLRGSAEVVGTALLTLGVSLLLPFGWQAVFLVYAFGLVVLALYLLFVPAEQTASKGKSRQKKPLQLTKEDWRLSLGFAFVAGVIVLTNIAINVRVPGIVEHSGMGTAQTAGLILSLMQLTGIAAGISFAAFLRYFKERLLTVSGFAFGLMQLFIGLAPNLWVLTLSAIAAGFVYSIALTAIFYTLSERISSSLLNQATSIVILGCSAGATATTFVLSSIGRFSSHPAVIFSILGSAMILTALFALRIGKDKTSAL